VGTQGGTAKLVTRWRIVEKREILNSMPLNSRISEWLVKWGGPDTVIVA